MDVQQFQELNITWETFLLGTPSPKRGSQPTFSIVDRGAQLLSLGQHGYEELGDLVGTACIFTGDDLRYFGVGIFYHHLTQEMRGLHLQDVTSVLEDAGSLIHYGLQFVLETKGIFEIHI